MDSEPLRLLAERAGSGSFGFGRRAESRLRPRPHAAEHGRSHFAHTFCREGDTGNTLRKHDSIALPVSCLGCSSFDNFSCHCLWIPWWKCVTVSFWMWRYLDLAQSCNSSYHCLGSLVSLSLTLYLSGPQPGNIAHASRPLVPEGGRANIKKMMVCV